eukprot:m.104938 g.104938  ORF g.104938 m.104938 type:complete len:1154 (+) comp15683_c0_seq1:127-3588(+)
MSPRSISASRLLLVASFVVRFVAGSPSRQMLVPHTTLRPLAADGSNTTTTTYPFDGVGALSGGGATSNFLLAYPPKQRATILDWLFLPGFGASLDILKVEIGADDQTTDGSEACHMRHPDEVDCTRGYEWALMKEAVARNPAITLYGLPWGFAGWLGFGTTNPYHNVSATADYVARWVECGRDVHGLNVSVLGLWNEAWQARGRPTSEPWEYALALRLRLDAGGLGHVRIVVPDGDIGFAAADVRGNATLFAVTDVLGQHYPGTRGSTPAERALGLALWSSEDYSTYSDATGAACWARLLVQNVGWGYGATISWYLLGGFARGMGYDADGLIRAEWPASGHWELTPMLWTTMHWTLFTDPGWRVVTCSNPPCTLAGGGNYAVLVSNDGSRGGGGPGDGAGSVGAGGGNGNDNGANGNDDGKDDGKDDGGHDCGAHGARGNCRRGDDGDGNRGDDGRDSMDLDRSGFGDITIIFETFSHNTSRCIRNDPPDWRVALLQNVTVQIPPQVRAVSRLALWRSCASWRYPADDDGYLQRLADVPVAPKSPPSVTVELRRDCYYTLTSLLQNRTKPPVPTPTSSSYAPSASFPLPFHENFETTTIGAEAPFFGDQAGKWETVAAGCSRAGRAARQQLGLNAPWPILEPQCNDHGQPISIFGDLFMESTRVTADVLLESVGVGAGLGLRVRQPHNFFRGAAPGLFLYLGATPAQAPAPGRRENAGGLPPTPNTALQGWALCSDSFCKGSNVLRSGALPAGAPPMVRRWHHVWLEVTRGLASGGVDNATVFSQVQVGTLPAPPSGGDVARCVANASISTHEVIAGFDYKQVLLNDSLAPRQTYDTCVRLCCQDMACKAWAVEGGLCWLKHGGTQEQRPGQNASGLRPPSDGAASPVPPSGWAALVSTLGNSQVDNVALAGTAATTSSGLAVEPCNDTTPPASGSALLFTPCDFPNARTAWELLPNGTLMLRGSNGSGGGGDRADSGGGGWSHDGRSHGGSSGSSSGDGRPIRVDSHRDRTFHHQRFSHNNNSRRSMTETAGLCIGTSGQHGSGLDASAVASNVSLVSCTSLSAFSFDAQTGRIKASRGVVTCARAEQRQWHDPAPRPLTTGPCAALPSNAQQFQFNPTTGALRAKGSQCIAAVPGLDAQYRDCCVAVCALP